LITLKNDKLFSCNPLSAVATVMHKIAAAKIRSAKNIDLSLNQEFLLEVILTLHFAN
jgi:hypothetical protein